MRILVTGGAGFIGSHLVDAFATDGNSVVVLDNLSSGCRENLPADGRPVRLVEGDIRDPEAVAEAMAGVDAVFHMAACVSVPASVEDPVTSAAVNLQGTANVLHAATQAGVKRLIFATSAAVYGDTDQVPIREDQETVPLSPYGLHKLAGEHMCRVTSLCGGPDTLCFRFFNVYGARQRPDSDYAAVIPAFRKACRAGKSPTIFGTGQQTRDFIHVSDIVHAFRLGVVAEQPFEGAVFNLAGGEATTITDLAEAVMAAEGLDGEIIYAEVRAGDIEHSVAEVTKLENQFGWKPSVTLTAGLEL